MKRLILRFAITVLMGTLATEAVAQTITGYVRQSCTISWTANIETDLAGYRANVTRNGVTNPSVTIPVGPAPQTTCADLGVTADGSYAFSVIAFDTSNNVSPPALATVIRDTIAPNTTVTPTIATGGGASFALTSSEPNSTFDCKLDAGAWAPCTSPKVYSALPDGSHTFSARATDLARNTDLTDAQYTWTVNSIPPVAPRGLSVVDVTP